MAEKPLTFDECKAKAEECRDMARRAEKPEQRTMLEHMAETWERLCAEIRKIH